ncbi:MAG: hypothetical protein KDD22_07845 [Bdellovibrionales bacterium]|nr:hypothetical protein [Bdellovibrionales bacterium]
MILMDTPYRLGKLLGELKKSQPRRNIILGLNLNSEGEQILEGTTGEIEKLLGEKKTEFLLLVKTLAADTHKSKVRNK